MVDGSTAWNLNLIGAIEKCKEIGIEDDSNIIFDVIILLPEQIDDLEKNVTLNSY